MSNQPEDHNPFPREAPKLSVVTVALHSDSRLAKTARSLEYQADEDFEWIIVIAEPNPQIEVAPGLDRRLTVLYQQPLGIYPAMNLGLLSASAPFVAFLNAGDTYQPTAVRSLKSLSSSGGWGYGAVQLIRPPSSTGHRYSFIPFNPTLFRMGLRFVPHPAAVFDRGLLISIGGFSEEQTFAVSADQLVCMQLMQIAPPMVSQEVIASHYLDGASAHRSPWKIASDYRHMRIVTNNEIMGSAGLDQVATVLTAGARSVARRTMGVFDWQDAHSW